MLHWLSIQKKQLLKCKHSVSLLNTILKSKSRFLVWTNFKQENGCHGIISTHEIIQMLTLYIYPNTRKVTTAIQNPYINNLIDSLSDITHVVNKAKPTSLGIIDIYRKVFKIDVIIFSWLENLPDNRFGKVQSLLLLPLFIFCKLSNKKIVWILHNKKAHSDKNKSWKQLNYRLIKKYSDYILTHSSEGINYLKKISEKKASKAIFLHHPISKSTLRQSSKQKVYDILIWGAISPYKGIDLFLKTLRDKGVQDDFRILIAGKSVSEEYYEKIKQLAGKNVTVRNEFIEHDELSELILTSRIVLFTYVSDSVLSSGSLMDTILFDSKIVGPKTGAFADLSKEGLIECFTKYDELPELIQSLLETENNSKQITKRKHFIDENTWTQFAERFLSSINQKLFN